MEPLPALVGACSDSQLLRSHSLAPVVLEPQQPQQPRRLEASEPSRLLNLVACLGRPSLPQASELPPHRLPQPLDLELQAQTPLERPNLLELWLRRSSSPEACSEQPSQQPQASELRPPPDLAASEQLQPRLLQPQSACSEPSSREQPSQHLASELPSRLLRHRPLEASGLPPPLVQGFLVLHKPSQPLVDSEQPPLSQRPAQASEASELPVLEVECSEPRRNRPSASVAPRLPQLRVSEVVSGRQPPEGGSLTSPSQGGFSVAPLPTPLAVGLQHSAQAGASALEAPPSVLAGG